MTVPQELYAAMLDQQSACNGMLALKDTVINRMRDVLTRKDKEYMRTLKVHAEVTFEPRHAALPAHCIDITMGAHVRGMQLCLAGCRQCAGAHDRACRFAATVL